MDGASETLEGMIDAACRGARGAWRDLFAALLPRVERRVRGSRSFVGHRGDEDEVGEVVVAVFERLRRDDCRALKLFAPWAERHPDKDLDDWLTIVTTNVVRDHVARRLGHDGGDAAGHHLELDAIDDGAAGTRRRMGSATLASVNEIAELAAATLTPDQLAVLDDWLQGFEFAELAERRGLATGREAEKLIRSALARLRRQVDE